MQHILITGASGLVGTRLTELLLAKGHKVSTLGRNPGKTNKKVMEYKWNPDKNELDISAFEGVDTIIHLAGAGVAEKRWTAERKKEIIDSRIRSAGLLFSSLQKIKHHVTAFISASAVGIYGDSAARVLTEDAPAGSDFLAEVCIKWEEATLQFKELGMRVCRLRIGIVLAKDGGALPELDKTVPLGIAPYFAKDPLYYPWIHLDDVCGIFIHATENNHVEGAYNLSAPHPLPVKELVKDIVKAKNSHALLVPAPVFALKVVLGESAGMVTASLNCSAAKIQRSGYTFKFTDALTALRDIYKG
jgi:uncharacterized protein (TIGR01777 family)